MVELKDLLKRLRPKHGSQVEVAEKLGIKSQQMSQYESGSRNPKLGFYKKWKAAFNEDLQTMLDEANVSRGTENITQVDKRSNNKGKPLGGDPEVYRTIVEGNTEYVLIPRTVLQDTKLISTEQITNDRKIMDKLLEQNEKMISRLLTSETEFSGVKKRKDGA